MKKSMISLIIICTGIWFGAVLFAIGLVFSENHKTKVDISYSLKNDTIKNVKDTLIVKQFYLDTIITKITSDTLRFHKNNVCDKFFNLRYVGKSLYSY